MPFFSFFSFSGGVVVFGLARDGCLVRSWVGVTQWGCRCRRPASGVGCVKASKAFDHHHVREGWGGILAN